ncbi:hypothetical protein BDA99DRAFT_603630 [Phascolomyces articulosus]|uniref:Uncharacterized protein n=1 Tax=Phascolomyces articulosus TaxID=60185 RepID=A0AAD5KIL4_9FUNG|nr:hypothetical protein BDA99DRAFT_603630 [Phascolomyces articulosus]
MKIERALGAMEKYQTSKYMNNGYGSVTCTALFRHALQHPTATTAENIKEFYLNQLYAPLTRLVEKHPQLSLAVADFDKPNVHFVRLDDFDLASIVSIDYPSLFWDEGTALSTTISEETDREFDLNDHTVPLWHLRIGVHDDRPDECSITLAIQHAIGDGSSVAIFWRDLYTELNKDSITAPNNYTIRSNPEKPLLAAYEYRQPPKPNAWDKFSLTMTEKLKMYLPQPIKQYWFPDGWAGDFRGITDKALARHETDIRAIHVDKSIWEQVCIISKKQGVTPHAPIMAAIASAFAEIWGTDQTVETWTPINCRGFCNPPIAKDEMGNFVGPYVHMFTPASSTLSFWEKAKTYHTGLRANKYEGAKDANYMTTFNYPDDFQTWWYSNWDTNPMARSGGIECSDLGRFMTEQQEKAIMIDSDYPSWKLQGLWFAQSSQMFTNALNLNCISTSDCMYGTVGWQRGSLDESKVERFGPLVIHYLKMNCQ